VLASTPEESRKELIMGKPSDEKEPDTGAERRIRGGSLDGSERKSAVDHDDYEKRRNPDTELHLDDEEDTLYDDGLHVEDDDEEPLAGTRGSDMKP
jgi:hypothetical protein